MLDLVNVRVRSLLSLGLHEKGGADWIGPVLVARLPPRLRMRWEEITRGTMGDDSGGLCPDLLEFLDFFHKMVEMEESIYVPSENSQKRSQQRPLLSSSPKPPRKATLSGSFNTHAVSSKCNICQNSDHASAWKCSRFLNGTFNERRSLCQRFFLCFNCLSHGHNVSSCQSSFRCRKCQGKHHTLLHKDPGRIQDTSIPAKPVTELTEVSSNATLSNPASETTSVLLQSCQAYAQGPTGDSLVVRVLFDSCSNYSFIRKSTADRLKLSEVSSIPLVINTFGCNVIKRDFSVTSVRLNSLRGGLGHNVDLIVTDDLVHPIQGHQVEIKKYEHLKSLFLPEDYHSGSALSVDVILGANYYHDFVSHKIKKGSRNEPVAVKTILGWTLHGPFASTKHIETASTPSTMLFCERVSVPPP